MDIRHLDPSEVEYLARTFTIAHERNARVRVAVDGGFKIAVGAGMWTPGMGKTDEQIMDQDVAGLFA